jgi:hypothetical protein
VPPPRYTDPAALTRHVPTQRAVGQRQGAYGLTDAATAAAVRHIAAQGAVGNREGATAVSEVVDTPTLTGRVATQRAVGERQSATVIDAATRQVYQITPLQDEALQGQCACGRHVQEAEGRRAGHPLKDCGLSPRASERERTGHRGEPRWPISVMIHGGQGVGAGRHGDGIGFPIRIGGVDGRDEAGHVPGGTRKLGGIRRLHQSQEAEQRGHDQLRHPRAC